MTIQTFSDTTQQHLQKTLLSIHDYKNRSYSLPLHNKEFRKALLDFGSQTPDNENCVSQIEYGRFRNRWGLKLRGTSVFLSQILQGSLESKGINWMLNSLQEIFPDLEREDLTTVLSFSYLLLRDIEKPFGLRFKLSEYYDTGRLIYADEKSKEDITNSLRNILVKQHAEFPASRLEFNISKEILPATGQQVLIWGIALKDYAFLTEILNELEECSPPNNLISFYNISTEQWAVTLRLLTLILLAFEGSEKI